MRRMEALAALLLWALPASGRCAAAKPPPEWVLLGGYGASVHLNPGRSNEHATFTQLQYGRFIGPHLEYEAAVHYERDFTPSGFVAGLIPLAARLYAGRNGRGPYVSVAAGFGWTDLTALEEIDRRFNFLLQGGLGVRFGPRGAGLLEVKLLHISNGGTAGKNLGLNAVAFAVGWRIR